MKQGRKHLTVGIDAGSSAVKVAIMASNAGEDPIALATSAQRIRRRVIFEVVEAAMDEACTAAGVTRDDFDYIASTGDGDVVPFRTGHFYSMTTHARGAVFFDPTARAALDIGALHARAIRMEARGKVLGQKMTSQCASGSGQFLENIARYLGVPLDDVGELSLKSADPEACSSICAVLAETDVINMVSRGIATADILKGIHISIAGRLARLVRSIRAEDKVMLTGGLAHDVGLLAALREQLAVPQRGRKADSGELEVVRDERSVLAGAFGAALLGAYRYEQLEKMGRLEYLTSAAGKAATAAAAAAAQV